jgi:putative membrane protein insertion efficiency factor
MTGLAKTVCQLPSTLLVSAVRLYQCTLSPLIGRHCRFEPTCSAYFIQAVEKYGAIRGTWRGLKRIGRCHPFNPGGYDPP